MQTVNTCMQNQQTSEKSAFMIVALRFSNLSFDCLESFFPSSLAFPSSCFFVLSSAFSSEFFFFQLRLPCKSRPWRKRTIRGCQPHEWIPRQVARSLWFLSERRDFLSTFNSTWCWCLQPDCYYESVGIVWAFGCAQVPLFINIFIKWKFHDRIYRISFFQTNPYMQPSKCRVMSRISLALKLAKGVWWVGGHGHATTISTS